MSNIIIFLGILLIAFITIRLLMSTNKLNDLEKNQIETIKRMESLKNGSFLKRVQDKTPENNEHNEPAGILGT